MKKVIILIIAIAIIAVGAYFVISQNGETTETGSAGQNNNTEQGYIFVSDGLEIKIDDEFTREKYGIEREYSEVASCAFEGLDRTYKYDGYDITTYENGEKENILSVYFTDDTSLTKEGIGTGSSFDEMVTAYGENYTQEDNLYTYTKGNMKLNFIVENDFVTSVEYILITDAK